MTTAYKKLPKINRDKEGKKVSDLPLRDNIPEFLHATGGTHDLSLANPRCKKGCHGTGLVGQLRYTAGRPAKRETKTTKNKDPRVSITCCCIVKREEELKEKANDE